MCTSTSVYSPGFFCDPRPCPTPFRSHSVLGIKCTDGHDWMIVDDRQWNNDTKLSERCWMCFEISFCMSQLSLDLGPVSQKKQKRVRQIDDFCETLLPSFQGVQFSDLRVARPRRRRAACAWDMWCSHARSRGGGWDGAFHFCIPKSIQNRGESVCELSGNPIDVM